MSALLASPGGSAVPTRATSALAGPEYIREERGSESTLAPLWFGTALSALLPLSHAKPRARLRARLPRRFYLLFTGVVRFLTKDKHVSEMSERERALLRKNR